MLVGAGGGATVIIVAGRFVWTTTVGGGGGLFVGPPSAANTLAAMAISFMIYPSVLRRETSDFLVFTDLPVSAPRAETLFLLLHCGL
jgi:hypothetical protein